MSVDLPGYARQLPEGRTLQARTGATVAMVNALEVRNGAAGADQTPARLRLTEIADQRRAEATSLNAGTRLLGWRAVAFGVARGAQFRFDPFRSLVDLRTPGRTGGAVEASSSTNAPRDPGRGAAGAGT